MERWIYQIQKISDLDGQRFGRSWERVGGPWSTVKGISSRTNIKEIKKKKKHSRCIKKNN